MTHDDLRELTGAYALGILEGTERREFEAHLPTCETCAAEVRSFTHVAAGLAHAVDQEEPPGRLRARVLAAVQREQLRGRAVPPRSVSPWLAIAACLAAVGFAFYALALRARVDALHGQLRNAAARSAEMERQLADVRAQAEATHRTTAILVASDVRAVTLTPPTGTSPAMGRAYWSPSQGLVFTATSLPPLPPGRAYQLWVIPPGGAPVGMGLLPADQSRVVAVPPPSGVNRVATVAVSVEPAGGVSAPTGPIVLAGSL